MKNGRFLKQAWLCLCLAVGIIFTGQAQTKYVVLISIDGMRPDIYLDKGWPTPNLQQLMTRGTYAEHMRSVFPAYTYPSHSSMVTGAYPATHGVCYNAPFDTLGGTGDGSWFWSAKNIHARTIWDAAKAAGLTTAAIEWPVSVDAPVTWNIPEIWPVKASGDRITESRKHSTKGLIGDIEKNATGKLTSQNMNEDYLTFDEKAGQMAAYVITKHKPNLIAVHFACVDGEEHAEGIDGPKVRQAVESADRAVGEILEATDKAGIKDSTAVIIVGDHGFCNINIGINPNIWLAKANLWHAGKNWNCRFAPAGGSAFLYLQHPNDTSILSSVRSILENLPKQYQNAFRIIGKAELIKMGADKNAVLALAAKPGYVFGGATDGKLIFGVKGGHHGYDPNQPEMYTGFIASGAGIRRIASIQDMCVTDVAPIVMQLLGVDFKAPDGKVPEGLIRQVTAK